MRHVISGLTSYSGKCCFLSSLMNIFLTQGYNVTETDLFFYLDLLDVEYGFDLNYIGNSFTPALERLRKKSIGVYMSGHTGEEDFVRKITGILVENHVILLNVDTAGLRYNKAYTKGTGRPHFILLYGIDTENQTAYIFDSHIREYSGQISTYTGTISLSEIACAVRMMYWFTLDTSEAFRPEEIHEAIIGSLGHFLGSDDTRITSPGRSSSLRTIFGRGGKQTAPSPEIRSGLHGSAALKKYIADFTLLSNLDRSEFAATCTNINYNIRLMCYMHILEFMTYLLTEYTIYQSGDHEELLKNLEALYQGWNKIALILLKVGMTDKRDRIPEVIARSELLLETQESVFRRILSHISAYRPG